MTHESIPHETRAFARGGELGVEFEPGIFAVWEAPTCMAGNYFSAYFSAYLLLAARSISAGSIS
jgi:hypothetical protein